MIELLAIFVSQLEGPFGFFIGSCLSLFFVTFILLFLKFVLDLIPFV